MGSVFLRSSAKLVGSSGLRPGIDNARYASVHIRYKLKFLSSGARRHLVQAITVRTLVELTRLTLMQCGAIAVRAFGGIRCALGWQSEPRFLNITAD